MRLLRIPYGILLPALFLAGIPAGTLAPAAFAQNAGTGIHPVFEGNRHVPDDVLLAELRGRGVLPLRRIPDSTAAAAIAGILQNVYAARSYPFSRITVNGAPAHGAASPRVSAGMPPAERRDGTESADDSRVRIRIDEGPRMVLGDVHFTGDTGLRDAALRDAMQLRKDAPFTAAALEQDIERLLALFDRSGYPFAVVRVADIAIRGAPDADAAPDTVRADIALETESGGLFRIEEFTVQGNELTDDDVIVRETRIERGAVYDAGKVADVRRRLSRLDFFSSVSEPRLYMRDGRGGLLLEVREGNANLFDGVVGYQPAAGDESEGYFTGLVNLSFRNLFGTGRRLDARWERATREVSELELRYLEPWLFNLPLNAAGGFFQRQQDSAYVRRAVDGEIRYLATADLQFAATVQSVEVIPSVNATDPGLRRSSILAGGVELRIDTRDDAWNPRAGIFLRNSYSGGNKRFTSADGQAVTDFQQRIEIDAASFHELLSRTVLAVSLHGRELRGDELDVSDLYRLGGANTLRGYREEQFAGTRFGWINTELRYSLGRRTFAFLFYDFGYIYQSPDTDRGREEFSAFRGGYGIGGRIETALGIMGVSYALGQGDGFADGKIHFGLINAF